MDQTQLLSNYVEVIRDHKKELNDAPDTDLIDYISTLREITGGAEDLTFYECGEDWWGQECDHLYEGGDLGSESEPESEWEEVELLAADPILEDDPPHVEFSETHSARYEDDIDQIEPLATGETVEVIENDEFVGYAKEPEEIVDPLAPTPIDWDQASTRDWSELRSKTTSSASRSRNSRPNPNPSPRKPAQQFTPQNVSRNTYFGSFGGSSDQAAARKLRRKQLQAELEVLDNASRSSVRRAKPGQEPMLPDLEPDHGYCSCDTAPTLSDLVMSAEKDLVTIGEESDTDLDDSWL